MESFPTKSFRSQGTLRFLRAFSSEVNKKIVAFDLERAGKSLDSAIVEYAHLVINPADGSVASGWGLMNPKGPIEESMSLRHKVYPVDVEGKPTIDAYAEKLAELYRGAVVVCADSTRENWETLKTSLVRAGISAETLGSVRLIELQDINIPCSGGGVQSSQQTFDRVMESCGKLSGHIFNNGAKTLYELINNQEKKYQEESNIGEGQANPFQASAQEKGLVTDSKTGPGESVSPSDRAKVWLNARIEAGEIFPSWSQRFLIEKLQQKSPIPGGPIDSNASAFGFALSDALKSGVLQPSALVHPGLMKEMVPTLAKLIGRPQLTLTEAQKSLSEETARAFDYPMIRAALMILGHPSYAAQKKAAPTNNGPQSKQSKPKSMSM